MKRMLTGLGFAALLMMSVADRVSAQYPGESVVYETVAPGSRTVTYGEVVKVKQKRNKTVIRERPARFVATTPPVVRETRVIQPAPVIESRLVQPAPVVETRLVQPRPVIQTRYLGPYVYPY